MKQIQAISRNSSFNFRERTQFTFIADDRTLSCILSGIAGKRVNITIGISLCSMFTIFPPQLVK